MAIEEVSASSTPIENRMETDSSPHSIDTYNLFIFGQLHKLDQLHLPPLKGKKVRLVGVDSSHPSVMYHIAKSLNEDSSVSCVDGSFPTQVSAVSHIDITKKPFLLHVGNFENVDGSYFVTDGKVSRMEAPQHIVIVSELTHNQWLYLGHLQSINPAPFLLNY